MKLVGIDQIEWTRLKSISAFDQYSYFDENVDPFLD